MPVINRTIFPPWLIFFLSRRPSPWTVRLHINTYKWFLLKYNLFLILYQLPCFCSLCYRPVVSRTAALSAEWAPKDGEWKEKDFEAEIKKLEKEAEERLDAKIADMKAKIESTGAK